MMENKQALTFEQANTILNVSTLAPSVLLQYADTLQRTQDQRPEFFTELAEYNAKQNKRKSDADAFRQKWGAAASDAAFVIGKKVTQQLINRYPPAKLAVDATLEILQQSGVAKLFESVYPDMAHDMRRVQDFVIEGAQADNQVTELLVEFKSFKQRFDQAHEAIEKIIVQNDDLLKIAKLSAQDILDISEKLKTFGIEINEQALTELPPIAQLNLKQIINISKKTAGQNSKQAAKPEKQLQADLAAAQVFGEGLQMLGQRFGSAPIAKIGGAVAQGAKAASQISTLLGGGLTFAAGCTSVVGAGIALVGLIDTLFGSNNEASQLEWLHEEMVAQFDELRSDMLEEFAEVKGMLSEIQTENRRNFGTVFNKLDGLKQDIVQLHLEQRKNTKIILDAVVYNSDKNALTLMSAVDSLGVDLKKLLSIKDSIIAVQQHQDRHFEEVKQCINNLGVNIQAKKVLKLYNGIVNRIKQAKEHPKAMSLEINQYGGRRGYVESLNRLYREVTSLVSHSYLSGTDGNDQFGSFKLLHFDLNETGQDLCNKIDKKSVDALLQMPFNGMRDYLSQHVSNFEFEALPNFTWWYKLSVLYLEVVKHYRVDRGNPYQVENGEILDDFMSAQIEGILKKGMLFEKFAKLIKDRAVDVKKSFITDELPKQIQKRIDELAKQASDEQTGSYKKHLRDIKKMVKNELSHLKEQEIASPNFKQFRQSYLQFDAEYYGCPYFHRDVCKGHYRMSDEVYKPEPHTYGEKGSGSTPHRISKRVSIAQGASHAWAEVKQDVLDYDLVFRWYVGGHVAKHFVHTGIHNIKNTVTELFENELDFSAADTMVNEFKPNLISEYESRERDSIKKFHDKQDEYLNDYCQLLNNTYSVLDISKCSSVGGLLDQIACLPCSPLITCSDMSSSLKLIVPKVQNSDPIVKLFNLSANEVKEFKKWVLAEMQQLGKIQLQYHVEDKQLNITANFLTAKTDDVFCFARVTYPFSPVSGYTVERFLATLWIGGQLAEITDDIKTHVLQDVKKDYNQMSIPGIGKDRPKIKHWRDDQNVHSTPYGHGTTPVFDQHHGTVKPGIPTPIIHYAMKACVEYPEFNLVDVACVTEVSALSSTLMTAPDGAPLAALPGAVAASIVSVNKPILEKIQGKSDQLLYDKLCELDRRYRMLQYLTLLTNSVNDSTASLFTDSKITDATDTLSELMTKKLCTVNIKGLTGWIERYLSIVASMAGDAEYDVELPKLSDCFTAGFELFQNSANHMLQSDLASLNGSFQSMLDAFDLAKRSLELKLVGQKRLSKNMARGDDVEIGRGATGIVSKRLYGNGRVVAVKVINGGGAIERARILNEIKIGEVLSNPSNKNKNTEGFSHVVKILNTQTKPLGYEMELAEYGTLDEFMEKNSQLSARARMQMFLDCLKGLQYLHENKVVHCDIKPQNVLVMNQTRLVLSDYGISKVTQATRTNQTTYGATDATNGTMRWKAHELIRSSKKDENPFGLPATSKHKPSSDVQSMAFLGLYLMTGCLPFDGVEREGGIATKVIMGKLPEIPSKLRVAFPALALLIEWGMEQLPQNRPKACEMVDCLKLILSPEVTKEEAQDYINQLKDARLHRNKSTASNYSEIQKSFARRRSHTKREASVVKQAQTEEEQLRSRIECLQRDFDDALGDKRYADLEKIQDELELKQEELEVLLARNKIKTQEVQSVISDQEMAESAQTRITPFIRSAGKSPIHQGQVVIRLRSNDSEAVENQDLVSEERSLQ